VLYQKYYRSLDQGAALDEWVMAALTLKLLPWPPLSPHHHHHHHLFLYWCKMLQPQQVSGQTVLKIKPR
jgi:hypothetical protein